MQDMSFRTVSILKLYVCDRKPTFLVCVLVEEMVFLLKCAGPHRNIRGKHNWALTFNFSQWVISAHKQFQPKNSFSHWTIPSNELPHTRPTKCFCATKMAIAFSSVCVNFRPIGAGLSETENILLSWWFTCLQFWYVLRRYLCSVLACYYIL